MTRLPTRGRQRPADALRVLADRARDTDRGLRELASAAGELTGAVVRRGLFRILDSGGFVVESRKVNYVTQAVSSDTFEMLRLGALPDDPLYNRPDGSLQQALVIRRDDGTTAFAVREGRANDGQYSQAWVLSDRSGAVVIAEDTNSGRGVARPHLNYPTPQPTNVGQWITHDPSANSTEWTSIARCEPEPENARMWWNVRTVADAGVTAEFRWCWQLDGGVQAPVLLRGDGGSAMHTLTGDDPVTGYRFGFWRETSVPLPAGVTTQRRTTLDLQVRITAGAAADGKKVARASVLALGGDQS